MEYTEDGTPVVTFHPPESEVRFRHLLEGPAVSPVEFVNSVKSLAEANLTARVRYLEPNPVLDLAFGLKDVLYFIESGFHDPKNKSTDMPTLSSGYPRLILPLGLQPIFVMVDFD